MTLPSLSDYTNLITPYQATRPDFNATVGFSVEPFADLTSFIASLPSSFDLDVAVGVQLDVVGQWAGISRYITMPLPTPWFAFDTADRGFDQGIWLGPLSPTYGISPLDDETYRDLIRAKILANNWDGTFGNAKGILDEMFLSRGIDFFVEDRQDMSIVFGAGGIPTPNAILLAIMAGKYIPLKPAGVQTAYVLSSVSEAPLFGFDLDTSEIAGFDAGGWGVSPSTLLGI